MTRDELLGDRYTLDDSIHEFQVFLSSEIPQWQDTSTRLPWLLEVTVGQRSGTTLESSKRHGQYEIEH
jgi:hypothetical protein